MYQALLSRENTRAVGRAFAVVLPSITAAMARELDKDIERFARF